jgi:hypothetical protein
MRRRDVSSTTPGQLKPVQVAEKSVFTKIFLIAIASFIVSGMVTWVMALAISELPQLSSWVGRSNYSYILFITFLVGFIINMSAFSLAFLSKKELAGEVYVKEKNTSNKVDTE